MASMPQEGTLLTRRYKGREIIVKVLEEGFEYQSQHYGSLSAIALVVTGTVGTVCCSFLGQPPSGLLDGRGRVLERYRL